MQKKSKTASNLSPTPSIPSSPISYSASGPIEARRRRTIVHWHVTVVAHEARRTGTVVLVWASTGAGGTVPAGTLVGTHIQVYVTQRPGIARQANALARGTAVGMVSNWTD